MIRDTIAASLISFFVCVCLCPVFIPFLHRMKFGQQVRNDGPKDHLKKSGTPTMGGIVILIAVLTGSLPYAAAYPLTVPVILMMCAFGVIGFLDDFLKIKKKKSEGLKAGQKFLMQAVVTGVFAAYLLRDADTYARMLVPFTGNFAGGTFLNTGILFVPVVFLAVLGTDNGVNFTDGLDGLCASVTIAFSLFAAAAAFGSGVRTAPVAGAVAGSLMGFLLYNVNPAKVFMGDTGSLALGGYAAALFLIMRLSLFIPVVGFIYLMEVLSVIIQVLYFKKTHGKRFFRMAPIHHHFELGGWSEPKVVAVFTAVTAVAGLFCLLGFM
jgi:phospho-N-acetylmuramoyl-pentapeptide-transferase